MKKYFILLLLITSLLSSCESEEWAEWKPVKLDISGVEVSSTGILHLCGNISARGASITIDGPTDNKDLRHTCINSIQDLYASKWYQPDISSLAEEPPYWGSDSWLSGEWWKVTYEKTETPFKIKLDIYPNPSKEERILKIDFGNAYYRTTLTLTQQGSAQ